MKKREEYAEEVINDADNLARKMLTLFSEHLDENRFPVIMVALCHVLLSTTRVGKLPFEHTIDILREVEKNLKLVEKEKEMEEEQVCVNMKEMENLSLEIADALSKIFCGKKNSLVYYSLINSLLALGESFQLTSEEQLSVIKQMMEIRKEIWEEDESKKK